MGYLVPLCIDLRHIAKPHMFIFVGLFAGFRIHLVFTQKCSSNIVSELFIFLDWSSLGIDDAKIEDSSLRGGVLEDDPESERASSKASTSDSDGQQNQKSGPQWGGFFRKLKKGPAMGLHTFHPSIPSIKLLSRKNSRNSRKSLPIIDDPTFDSDLCCFKSSWKNFSLSELETATDSFSHGVYFLQNFHFTVLGFVLSLLTMD